MVNPEVIADENGEVNLELLPPRNQNMNSEVITLNPNEGEHGKGASNPPNFREREKWDKNIEFALSTIGFAVGLGNMWRFPYLCYKNGGGAFLIPYFICLVTGGIPVFFLEVALGQYTSEGGISVWRKIAPIFTGIGYATTIICFLLNVYYIVILAWAVHFFFASFTTELPWAKCTHSWNTPDCFDMSSSRTALNGSNIKDASVEYWENRVLGITSGIDEVGSIQWELAGCLLFSWVLVYFSIWRGVKKSTGKVVYVTATFPYLMMFILFFRGVTLPGAWTGIQYYLTPDFTALWKGQVWIDAGTQIFFSYAIALGCMTALGSYNDFNHNFIKDCSAIACINSGTSFFAGFVVFSVLGFMAEQQGTDVSQVAESGPGLVFIAYPKALAQMPLAPLWSALFFFMIILLGLNSQFVGVEGFVTAVVDAMPHILRVGKRREIFIAGVALVSFLIGLTMVTNGGMYVFQIFDYYCASGMTLLWVSFCECVAVAWYYGIGRFTKNIKEMVGFVPHIWLPIAWSYLTPILTMGILLYSILRYEPLTYNKKYQYPAWAQLIGWMLALSSMIMIPAHFMYHQTKNTIQVALGSEESDQPSPEEGNKEDGIYNGIRTTS